MMSVIRVSDGVKGLLGVSGGELGLLRVSAEEGEGGRRNTLI